MYKVGYLSYTCNIATTTVVFFNHLKKYKHSILADNSLFVKHGPNHILVI